MSTSSPNTLRPIVFSGPSGTGKSTLLNRLFAKHPDTFGFSVSHTTRQPRLGEEDGKAYHFTNRSEFLKLVEKGAFIEYVEFSGNLYGTTIQAVEDVGRQGRRCILDIDSQGVKLFKINAPHLNALYVFLSPPDVGTLQARLSGRGTESAHVIDSRLALAKGEIAYAKTQDAYDVVIVNDDLDRAYVLLESVALTGAVPPSGGNTLPPLDHVDESPLMEPTKPFGAVQAW